MALFVFLVLFRFSFPYASGPQWNIILLAFVPVCTALIPYLYVLEASPPTVSAKRVSVRRIAADNAVRLSLDNVLEHDILCQ